MSAHAQSAEADSLFHRFRQVRQQSTRHCQTLEVEDYGLQACPETSPAKWHLAHTSWFFETFLLRPFLDEYHSPDEAYAYLYNSYYNGVGRQFPRAERGLLSRPTVAQVFAYREHVDHAMEILLGQRNHPARETIEARLKLGLNHEQQHQELFFTDLKFNLSRNPLYPVYRDAGELPRADNAAPLTWLHQEGGMTMIGSPDDAFCFDNETPRHRVWLAPFEIASRPVTQGEWLAFMADGGYQRPELWLADGWAIVSAEDWQHPLYWVQQQDGWYHFTLHGLQPLNPSATVCHLSAYEADAYARWADARLPTEAEWEHVAAHYPVAGHFVDSDVLQPGRASDTAPAQLFGSVWEWTSSAYSPYPGFRPAEGAIGEYNGKFMCNQMVLRGGSCVSERGHLRAGYRNFFYPRDRWQFSGLRLARSPA